jgi:hypothetical protein
MKKTLAIIFISFCMASSFISEGQSLTFEVRNPRIYKAGSRTFLQWEIYMKASSAETYLYATQLAFSCATPANFVSSSSASLSVDLSTGFLVPWVAHYLPSKGWNGSKFSFGVILDGINWGGYLFEEEAVLVPTTFSKLGLFGVQIEPTAGFNGTAGLSWDGVTMIGGNGQTQQYGLEGDEIGAAWHYYGANSFSGREFTDLYLARIYSGAWGWSQFSTSVDGQSIDWTTARNTSVWDTTATPAPITETNYQANNLRIHPGAKLSIDYTGNLTTSGSIEINQPKGILIKSNTSTPYQRGQLIDNGSISYNNGGSFQVMASFPQNAWHYYCIPFTQASMNSVVPYQGLYMKYYEENLDHWKYISSLDTNLNTMQMRGYSIWPSSTSPVHSGTVYPTGPINTGSIFLTCTRSSWSGEGGGYNGYNLIGNPYTSSIDLENAGWNCAANVDATAYYYDGSTYTTYGWVSHAGSGPRYPAPQQAFLVHLSTLNTATVSVNNTARVLTNGTPTKALTTIPEYLKLTASANGINDDAHIIFNSNATLGFDTQLDAYKLFGVESAPNLYSRMDTIMAVNELPWTGINQVVPMGFVLKVAAPVTITASHIDSFKPGTVIILEDKKEGTMNDLTANPVYSFTASANDDASRFALHFYNPSAGIDNKDLAGMQIYSFENYLYIRNLGKGATKGTVQVYDPLGRKVFASSLKDMELNKYLPGVTEGYYMVRVVAEDNAYSQKVYLK